VLPLVESDRIRVRVLDISPFYDENGQRSSFVSAPRWRVGQIRTMNPNSLDDSPPDHQVGRPYDCPSCHERTQLPAGPRPIDLDSPGRDSREPNRLDPSRPRAFEPGVGDMGVGPGRFDRPLTPEQQRLLIDWLDAAPADATERR
jgi:hypothetical protein